MNSSRSEAIGERRNTPLRSIRPSRPSSRPSISTTERSFQSVAERFTGKLLGDVQLKAPARLLHELDRGKQPPGIGAGVGLKLAGVVGVPNQLVGAPGESREARVPKRGDRQRQVERRRLGPAPRAPDPL